MLAECYSHLDCRRTGGKQQVYIKISEAEIADDYPEPTQYDKVQPTCLQGMQSACLAPLNKSSHAEVNTYKESPTSVDLWDVPCLLLADRLMQTSNAST